MCDLTNPHTAMLGRWEGGTKQAKRGSAPSRKRPEATTGLGSALMAAAVIAIVGGDWGDVLIGAGCALVLGLVIVPGWTALWSAATYETRHLGEDVRITLGRVQPAIAQRSPLALDLEKLYREGERLRKAGPEHQGQAFLPQYAAAAKSWEDRVVVALSPTRPDLANEFQLPRPNSALDTHYHPVWLQFTHRLEQLKGMITDVDATA